jgi:hypothetical protein
MAKKVQFKILPKLRVLFGKEDLTIVGGMIAEKDVLAWLAKWSLSQMPWQLWETTDELDLKHDSALPTLTALELIMLERVRFFGEGGDLTVRRDDEQFRWYFVGPKGVIVPDGALSQDNFWHDNPQKKLTRFKGQVILWGVWDSESDKKRWVENRVGFAKLAYPEPLHGQRHVYAHYGEFLDAGQVAFVWMYKLGPQEHDPLLAEKSPKPETTPKKVRKVSAEAKAQSVLSGKTQAVLPADGSQELEAQSVGKVSPEPREPEFGEPKSQDDRSQLSEKDDKPKARTITEIIQGLFKFGGG